MFHASSGNIIFTALENGWRQQSVNRRRDSRIYLNKYPRRFFDRKDDGTAEIFLGDADGSCLFCHIIFHRRLSHGNKNFRQYAVDQRRDGMRHIRHDRRDACAKQTGTAFPKSVKSEILKWKMRYDTI